MLSPSNCCIGHQVSQVSVVFLLPKKAIPLVLSSMWMLQAHLWHMSNGSLPFHPIHNAFYNMYRVSRLLQNDQQQASIIPAGLRSPKYSKQATSHQYCCLLIDVSSQPLKQAHCWEDHSSNAASGHQSTSLRIFVTLSATLGLHLWQRTAIHSQHADWP